MLEYAGQEVCGAIAIRLEGVCSHGGSTHGAGAFSLEPLAHAFFAEYVITGELDGTSWRVLADGTLGTCTHIHFFCRILLCC